MRHHQDIFDFEHVIEIDNGDDAVLRVIGAFTAVKMPKGTWVYDYHYGAYFGDVWLKSSYMDNDQKGEIEAMIDRIITLRVGALTIEASSLE